MSMPGGAPGATVPLARIFAPFAAGYFLSYVFRNINATIFRDLVADLGLQASALGLLTSAFLFVFAAAQLPIGLLLDRFGPRRVNAAMFLVAAAGAAGFALGHTVGQLLVARAFIGLGVAAGLMAAMQSFTLWYPIERLATLNGFLMALGGVGAMVSTAPVEAALRFTDWRGVFIALSLACVGVAAAVWIFVPQRKTESGTGLSFGQLLAGLVSVLRDREFWRISGVALTTLGPAIALQGLWIGPWLRDVLGLDRASAAQAMFGFTVALTLGFLTWGKLADALAARGVPMILTYVCAALVSVVALALLALGVTTGSRALWAVYIFTITASTLGYPLLARRFPPALTGRVNSSLNMSAFCAAFLAQGAIGPLLDRFARADGGFEPEGYRLALGLIVLAQVLALLAIAPTLRRTLRESRAQRRGKAA
jgi:MFS family permease